jgi:hypothetical protein
MRSHIGPVAGRTSLWLVWAEVLLGRLEFDDNLTATATTNWLGGWRRSAGWLGLAGRLEWLSFRA